MFMSQMDVLDEDTAYVPSAPAQAEPVTSYFLDSCFQARFSLCFLILFLGSSQLILK